MRMNQCTARAMCRSMNNECLSLSIFETNDDFNVYSNFIYAMILQRKYVFEFLTFEHPDKNLLMTKWVFLMRNVSGGKRERGPQSPFVGWILINSTRVLAINNKL